MRDNSLFKPDKNEYKENGLPKVNYESNKFKMTQEDTSSGVFKSAITDTFDDNMFRYWDYKPAGNSNVNRGEKLTEKLKLFKDVDNKKNFLGNNNFSGGGQNNFGGVNQMPGGANLKYQVKDELPDESMGYLQSEVGAYPQDLDISMRTNRTGYGDINQSNISMIKAEISQDSNIVMRDFLDESSNQINHSRRLNQSHLSNQSKPRVNNSSNSMGNSSTFNNSRIISGHLAQATVNSSSHQNYKPLQKGVSNLFPQTSKNEVKPSQKRGKSNNKKTNKSVKSSWNNKSSGQPKNYCFSQRNKSSSKNDIKGSIKEDYEEEELEFQDCEGKVTGDNFQNLNLNNFKNNSGMVSNFNANDGHSGHTEVRSFPSALFGQKFNAVHSHHVNQWQNPNLNLFNQNRSKLDDIMESKFRPPAFIDSSKLPLNEEDFRNIIISDLIENDHSDLRFKFYFEGRDPSEKHSLMASTSVIQIEFQVGKKYNVNLIEIKHPDIDNTNSPKIYTCLAVRK